MVNPLPVQDFANILLYNIEDLHSMLHESKPVILRAGLEVKPRKCGIFHDRRSGNNW